MRHILAALALTCLAIGASRATPMPGPDQLTLENSIVVPAPRAEVWALWATSEGFASWAAPVAHVELKQGGVIESSYDRTARIGDAGNIRNAVLAVVPGERFSIRVTQAPPGFPHADLVGNLITIVAFTDAGPGATRVTVTMLGFLPGEGYDALRTFFARGNAYTLDLLAARIANGPTDWTKT